MVAEAPGSVRLVLAPNVVHLDPEPAVFSAMREGWARQQSARFLQPTTIQPRLRLIERFGQFTGNYTRLPTVTAAVRGKLETTLRIAMGPAP